MDKVINSPITYPGGKRWLLKRLVALMPADTQEMVSPFFGGGAIELNLAVRGVRVHGYDLCPHLTNFWQQWLHNPCEIICDAPKILRQYDRESLVSLKSNFEYIAGAEHRALLFYIFNRLAFGGKTLHDKEYLKKFQEKDGVFFRADGTCLFPNTDFWHTARDLPLTVGCADFSESLAWHPTLFAYLDPPYFKVGKNLYLTCKDGFDHERLVGILNNRPNWILSYNDCDVIRKLYVKYPSISMAGRNFSTNRKTSMELLIFSQDIGERLRYSQQHLF